ncbi:dihydrodipicolinate synthase family protein [Ferruginivarius sediminum]|uniref:Dihydrodipicolinate synthase family protein n=1 Tax=Ferruginivarius sediminum TaxID=2661937 RepID=A0A369T9U3_9PROT|nr:dihydrodipicolinate synthase family protein [Ferruginivarius sediminum]RDD62083.1 dihydrodipicolinate synthase family protein [Ferruginivarius sediminum]
MERKLDGIWVPAATPLRADGRICEESLRRLIESTRSHAAGLLPALSSGEGWKLDRQTWVDLVAAVVKHADGLPVFPGIVDVSREELFWRAGAASALGVSGLTIPVPELGSDPEKARDDFAELLRLIDMPITLYFEQSPPASNSAMQALIDLCNLDQVVLIKESCREPRVANRLVDAKVSATVLQGWEDLCLQSPGVAGYALALANLEPELCRSMLVEPSEEKQERMTTVSQEHRLFDDDWFRPMKAVLKERGIFLDARPVPERVEPAKAMEG